MKKLVAITVLVGLGLGSVFVAAAAQMPCTVCTVRCYDLGWFGSYCFNTDCEDYPACGSSPF